MSVTTWPLGWLPITDAGEAAHLEMELRRELSGGHMLYGRAARAVGRHELMDDVLFELADGVLAEVHLTWNHETTPDWPTAELFDGPDDWSQNWLEG